MAVRIQEPQTEDQLIYYTQNRHRYVKARNLNWLLALIITGIDAFSGKELFGNIIIPSCIALALEISLNSTAGDAFLDFFKKGIKKTDPWDIFFSVFIVIIAVGTPIFYRKEMAQITLRDYQPTNKDGITQIALSGMNATKDNFHRDSLLLANQMVAEIEKVKSNYSSDKLSVKPTHSKSDIAWIYKKNAIIDRQIAAAVASIKLKYLKKISNVSSDYSTKSNLTFTTATSQIDTLLNTDSKLLAIYENKLLNRELGISIFALAIVIMRLVMIRKMAIFTAKSGTIVLSIASQSEFSATAISEIIDAIFDRINAWFKNVAKQIGQVQHPDGRQMTFDPAKETRLDIVGNNVTNDRVANSLQPVAAVAQDPVANSLQPVITASATNISGSGQDPVANSSVPNTGNIQVTNTDAATISATRNQIGFRVAGTPTVVTTGLGDEEVLKLQHHNRSDFSNIGNGNGNPDTIKKRIARRLNQMATLINEKGVSEKVELFYHEQLARFGKL